MTHHVIVSTRARDDLERNASWWAEHHDLDEALRWYDGFIAAIEKLTEYPRRCPLAPENHKVPHELRELHYGVGSHPTHRAIFTIVESDVRVLTVRHGAQDEVSAEELDNEE